MQNYPIVAIIYKTIKPLVSPIKSKKYPPNKALNYYILYIYNKRKKNHYENKF